MRVLRAFPGLWALAVASAAVDPSAGSAVEPAAGGPCPPRAPHDPLCASGCYLEVPV